ncbi:MAG: hypothetical protein DLM72_05255 [Candidatus Nitrosopolaris wilkensis]|nr:MAG: hypothetical protein DLM72_05255 [Candidatus Nitrosopolaris wilkensis]
MQRKINTDSNKDFVAPPSLPSNASWQLWIFPRSGFAFEAARDKLYISSIRLYGAISLSARLKNYGNHRLP